MNMIFAGVFNQKTDSSNQRELESRVRRAIYDEIGYWHHDMVSVAAGETSNGSSQRWFLNVKGGVLLGISLS